MRGNCDLGPNKPYKKSILKWNIFFLSEQVLKF